MANLTEDNFKHCLEIVTKMDIKGVEFTGGGEPLSNPLTMIYLPIFALATKVGMITNGVLITEENYQTIVNNCAFVRISLDAGSNEVHHSIHKGGEKDFDHICQMLRKMVKYKGKRKYPTLGVAFLIRPDNFHQIVDTARLIKEIGIDYINFRPCFTEYQYIKQTVGFDSGTFIMREKKLIDEMIEKAKELNEPNKFEVYGTFDRVQWTSQADYYEKCYATPLNPVIGADGTVYLCCERRGEMPIGNINEESFFAIWGSKKHKDMIKSINLSTCPAKCKYSLYNQIIKRWYIDNEAGWEFL
jgi:radical SAM protein with 4Fe4S-binding SPASM domain